MRQFKNVPSHQRHFLWVWSLVLLGVGVAGVFFTATDVSATHVSCGDVLTADTTLDSDLDCSGHTTSHGLIIGADNITLNCACHTITGPGTTTGIILTGRTGVTVKHCTVTNFAQGFLFQPTSTGTLSTGNTLKNNTADNNTTGFRLMEADGNALRANTANANKYGFSLNNSDGNTLKKNRAYENASNGFGLNTNSSGNTLKDNTADDNGSAEFTGYGFTLASATDNTLKGNMAYDNKYGFSLGSASTGNRLKKNTAYDNGLSGILVNKDSDGNFFDNNHAYDNGWHGFELGSSGNALRGNEASDNGKDGFHIVGGYGDDGKARTADDDPASNNVLTGNTAESNQRGIFLEFATETTLRGNEAHDNTGDGITLYRSFKDNKLTDNVILRNGSHGIVFYQSSNGNALRHNTINGSTTGVRLDRSSNNILEGNTASDNDTGFVLSGLSSNDNKLRFNTATGNTSLDMRDDNPDCDNNSWVDNTFTTSEVASGANPGLPTCLQ